jgi:co-chaperonin GroES (HSP10)
MATKPIDLEATTPLTEADLPVLPMFWNVIVEPLMPPEKTKGGILLSEETQEVERIQCTIGRVLAIGDLAFKGKTSSGIALGECPRAAALKAGQFVLFAKHTGQKIKIRKGDRQRLIILLSDSELLGIVSKPEMIRFWI